MSILKKIEVGADDLNAAKADVIAKISFCFSMYLYYVASLSYCNFHL